VRRDFWGRKYDRTQQHVVLPSYFEVDRQYRVSVLDDLAGAAPRSSHEDFYIVMEEIFCQSIPLLQSVYGYCRQIRQEVRTWEGPEMLDDDPESESPLPGILANPCSLREQKLQVTTRVETYLVTESFASEWRLGGRSHEEIVATALFVVDCYADLNECHVEFKRAFHKRKAHYVEKTLGGAQGRPVHKDWQIESPLSFLHPPSSLPIKAHGSSVIATTVFKKLVRCPYFLPLALLPMSQTTLFAFLVLESYIYATEGDLIGSLVRHPSA